eukprot:704389-Ditylum_brightwellii.AAC.1
MTVNILPGREENLPLIILNQKAKKCLQQENHTGMQPQPNPQVNSNHRNRREQPSIPPQQPSHSNSLRGVHQMTKTIIDQDIPIPKSMLGRQEYVVP